VGVVSLGVAASTSFLVFLGLRFVAGLLGAFGPPSLMAAVGDLAPPEKRGRGMAWLNFGFSLAAIVAVPLVGAIGGAFGWRWAFVAVAALLLVLAGLIHRAFPPPAPTRLGPNVFAGYGHVLRVPRLTNVLAANLLERAIFNAAALYLAPFLILSYAVSAVEIAPSLSLAALGALGGNVLGGWLADRFPKALTFVVAQVLAGLAALALFGAPLGLPASAAVGALFGLANSSSRPAFLALGSELAVRDRGAVLGLVSLTNQGGVAVGSAVGGLAIELGGYPALAWVAALGGVAAALFALPLARPRPTT
jgi:DHA1 family inner membrane transport protein